MRPRPIYRWRSFWLGVLVLCFLGWAWARSMTRDEGVELWAVDARGKWGLGEKLVTVKWCGGNFSVSEEDAWPGPFDMVWFSRPFREDEAWRRSWAIVSKEYRDDWVKRTWWVAFPTWVPLGAQVMVWGGWLAWRWRRRVC
ncbi:hypothetical protein [Luteolibacter soli]|uniref:DUF3592 domain-containing protein n=1 Tax=Luteolibacter soli TaxID=3135280 RepID=A0ABU9AWA4_9BACT